MRRFPPAATSLVVLITGLCANPSAVRGDTIEFVGGFFVWSDPLSWNNLDGPDEPPGPGDTALFNLGGAGYNFFLDTDATCDVLQFTTNGATWLSIGEGAPHELTLLQDAFVSGDQLQLLSLDLVVGGDLQVNNGATCFVSGTNVTVTGNVGLGLAPPFGDGTFTVSGSSLLTALGGTFVAGANANGTLTVQGGATANLQQLSVPSGGVDVASTGLVNVTNGATLTTSFLLVANTPDMGAIGQVHVTGEGSTLDPGTSPVIVGSPINSLGTILIEDAAVFERPALSTTTVNRTGAIDLNSGGTLNLGGTLTIDGGTVSTVGGGVLALQPDSGVSTDVVVNGFGLLDLGGSFVFGGVVDPLTHQSVLVLGASEARVELDWRMGPEPDTFACTEVCGVQGNGERSRLLGTAAAGDLVIGDAGSGSLLVECGGFVGDFDDVIVANLEGAGGTLIVTGQGGLGTRSALNAAGTLFVGGGPGAGAGTAGASGSVVVQDGGQLSAGALLLAAQAGSDAALTLGNPPAEGFQPSELVTSGRVDIGGDGATPGGTANATIWANGTIDAGLDVHVRPGSTLTLQGGTVLAEGDIGVGPTLCDPNQDDGGLVFGHGTLDPGFGETVVVCGRLRPGGVPPLPALIEIDGAYTQWGVLEIEIGGETPGSHHGQLIVSGVARLGGGCRPTPWPTG